MIYYGKKKILALATDWDGTAVDSVDSVYQASWEESFAQFGKKFPRSTSEEWCEYFGANPGHGFSDYIRYICKKFELPTTPEEFKKIVSDLQKEKAFHVRYKPGADVLARALKDRGVKVGIVSSVPTRMFSSMKASPYIWGSEMPIEDYDFEITGESCEFTKPHPMPYARGIELSGVRPEEVLVIEDLLDGVNSALGAGVPKENIIGIHDKHAEFHENEVREKVGVFVRNHQELIDILGI
jgi:beta-phosphoglucomutase-like phosphatase (HAD superfamily)